MTASPMRQNHAVPAALAILALAVPLVPALAAPPTPSAAEARLLALTNAERRKAGLAPLAWDGALAEVARAHSREMAEKQFVAHVSPTTGGPEDRLRRAGLRFPALRENVGMAASADEVHAALMKSPGHRANILSPEATNVGVGAVVGAVANSGLRALWVTEIFVLEVPAVDVATERAKVRKALAARRRECGGGQVASAPALEAGAQRLAAAMAEAGGTLEAGRRNAIFTEAASGYSEVSAVIGIGTDAAKAVEDGNVCRTARFVGVGVAQGAHPRLGDHALYTVVLLGGAEMAKPVPRRSRTH